MTDATILVPDADGVLTAPPLGLVLQSNDDYHRGPGISKSHLDTIADKSPAHYWARYINPDREPDEPTPAKILGSAVHAAILEPDLFLSEYITAPEINRRTNAGKAEWEAFVAENKGRTILTPDQMQAALAVRDAVHRHPVASGLLHGGAAEQSFYARDPEFGALVKCRTDYMAGDLITDVKSTEDASPAGFAKSAANYRYLCQVAWYWDVLDAHYGEHPPYWAFLAVEKEPPYAIGIYYPDANDVQRARMACRRDLARIMELRKSGVWPDYATEALPLAMPSWWRP